MIAAGGAAITRLTAISGVDPAVLQAIEPLLPADRHIDLDVAAAITSTLVRQRLLHITDPDQRAQLLANLASRLRMPVAEPRP